MKSALALIALATILVGCQNTSPPMRGGSEPATTSSPGSTPTVALTIVTTIFDDSIEEAYFKEHLAKIARNLITELDAIKRPPIGRFAFQINIREDGSFSVLQRSPNIAFTPFFDAMVRAIEGAAPFSATDISDEGICGRLLQRDNRV